MQTSDLVHKAYLRLLDQRHVNWQNRATFLRHCGRADAAILVDQARRRRRIKRGGGVVPITHDEEIVDSGQPAVDVIEIDEALTKLAQIDERKARIVKLRSLGAWKLRKQLTSWRFPRLQ